MSEWKKVKLKELVTIKNGKDHKSLHDGTIPVYGSGGIMRYVDKYLYDKESVLLPRKGTLNNIQFAKTPFWTVDTCYYTEVHTEKVLPCFLYFSLFKLDIEALNTGSAIPSMTFDKYYNIQVSLPPLPIQHRIASILSRYDSLIENYQKQIKLLEEAAQRLYKEWFVDLRFPGHENTIIVDGVPEGWEKKPLGSIVQKSIGGGWGKESRQGSYDKSAYVVRGTDISKLKNGSPDDIPFRYHTDSNLKERVLSDGDIIFEVSGGSEKEPVGRMYYITQQILDFYKERVICASFCKKVSFGDKNSSLLAYYAMQYCRESGDMKKYEKDSAGNIINFAWSTFLDDFIVLVPDKFILGSFCERVQAIINNLVNLSLQIRLLTEARDRLLPKLMSGEIKE